MRLVYTQDAVADLARLRTFIANHDPAAAGRVARLLVTRLGSLCDFPQMGVPVALAPEPDEVRDFVFGKYVVRYTPRGDTLVVLRIWHAREPRD